jgi:CRP/FNR family transcriptional regulator, cyclic AMP receptor protein
VYVVWEGRVKVSIGSDNGKSLILALAGRGAVLGLPETIIGLPYAATAEVVETAKASFLCRDHLLRRLRDTETAAYTAAENLGAICYSLTAELKAIHLTQSAEQKMARFFLGLPPTCKNSNGQMEVALTANQEEIGQMIGVCRETVARIISRFKRKRILELGASTLVIYDRPALEELAG